MLHTHPVDDIFSNFYAKFTLIQTFPGLPDGDQLEEEQPRHCDRHWAEGGEPETPAEDVQAQVPRQSCKFLFI